MQLKTIYVEYEDVGGTATIAVRAFDDADALRRLDGYAAARLFSGDEDWEATLADGLEAYGAPVGDAGNDGGLLHEDEGKEGEVTTPPGPSDVSPEA